MRAKTCKARSCRKKFFPDRSMQAVCSPRCGIELHRERQDKKRAEAKTQHRRDLRAWKEKNATIGELTKLAQEAFNAYIRARDKNQPCISCGVVNISWTRGGSWDCGHYRSVGANPELRFMPLNAAKQCKRCNRDLSGNIVNFRRGLLARIGPEQLEYLEGPHPKMRYRREDLVEIRARFKALASELKEAA